VADLPKPARPRKNPVAQAGNYSAEVDTAGMDPEMKEMLGVGVKPRKPFSFIDFFKKAVSKKKPPQMQ
jgi:hypothetical protein